MLNLYLIRHAESKMNSQPELISGQSNDVELSDRGIRQCQLLQKRFETHAQYFDEIYCSPAKRAMQTASILFSDKPLVDKRLLELNQGVWQGKKREEVYTEKQIRKINEDNWNFKPDQGESQKEVEERMLDFVESIPDKNIAVVTHGMAINCLLRGILNSNAAMSHKIFLGNTSITQLRRDEKGWYILSVNDRSHLYGTPELEDAYFKE